jgi:hypothetical protein
MLHVQGTYRLRKATAAIDRNGAEAYCFQVPAGALVLVNGFYREGALVQVIYARRPLLMFAEDILQRGQPVAAAPPSSYKAG